MPDFGHFTNSLEAALTYHRGGFIVIPCCWPTDEGNCGCGRGHIPRDVGKAPLIPGWESVRPTEDQISFWFGRQWPKANVGIVENPSGILVVDTDSLDAYAEAEELGLEPTVTRVSRNPAFLYRRPEGCPIKSATRKGSSGKIDVLASGQVVAYGRHSKGHSIYLQGTELAPAPQWAVDLLVKANGSTSEDIAQLPDVLPDPDIYDLNLEPQIKAIIIDGPEAAPGLKPSRSEYIAMVSEAMVNAGYDDLTIAGVIWHNQIGEKAREQGKRWLAKDIARSRKHAGEIAAQSIAVKPLSSKVDPDAPWEEPIPFYQADLPHFPTDCLPQVLRVFVEALAESTQTPRDLAGVLTLGAVATTVQRKVHVQLKPDWKEPLNMYFTAILPSGSRKTTVTQSAIAPIENYEIELASRMRSQVAAAEIEHKMAEARLDRLQKDAARANGAKVDELTQEITELASELASKKVPVMPRFFADDVTPEKLIDLMHEHNGRMAVFSAEGKIFDLMTGRYSTVPNFDVFLNAHCSETIRVDRLGRKANHVPKPALTLGLAVQPDVIRGLMKEPSLRGRGLLARFLYTWPESMLGSRKIDPDPMPPKATQDYAAMLLALCEIEESVTDLGLPKSRPITLSKSATALFRGFETWLEPQLAQDATLGGIADWAGKLAGHVARIAALLHLADAAFEDDPCEDQISGETMQSAIRIGHYFIAHALATFAEMGADETIEGAKHILRWIKRNELRTFTKHEAHVTLRGHFGRVDAMDPSLDLLVKQNYLRERQPERRTERGRRPGPAYDVNPLGWRS